jgi:uncharacterized protein (DUF58 family)
LRSLARAAFLGFASIIVLAGVALRSGALLSLLLPLIVLLVLEPMLARRQDAKMQAAWDPLEEQRFMEGDEVTLTLRLRNLGKGTDLLQYHVAMPEGLDLRGGRRSFPLAVAPGEEVALSFHFRLPQRGHFVVGPIRLEWRDLLRTYHVERGLDATMELWVMPVIQDLRRCDLRPTRVRPYVGNVRSRLLGAGSEFYSMREYRPGDELRDINWKASGRTGELLVNEHESERSGDVVIVVDARSEAAGNLRTTDILDWEVRAAASLSAFYLRRRDQVGMMVIAKFIDLVKPAFGRRQFYQIVEHLTATQVGGDRSTISVRLAMQRFFPPQSLMIYITPLDDERTAQSIMELSRRGYQIVVIAPILPPKEGPDRARSLQDRLDRVRRDSIIIELRDHCKVIDWETAEPLSKYLTGVRGWDRRA